MLEHFLCVDIGGTTIKSGIYDVDGHVIQRYDLLKTDNLDDETNIVQSLKLIIRRSQKKYQLSGVCISTAGVVDTVKGEVIYAGKTIPKYSKTPLKQLVEQEFNLPCEVENDVNAACLGELWQGNLRGVQDGVCLTIGTGIGSALLFKGQLHRGFSYTAGEVGYMKQGNQLFQEQASASFLTTKVSELKGEQLNGKKIFTLAKEGDLICLKAIEELVENLATGLVNIIYLLNPEVIVLGGGIMVQEDYLAPLIDKKMKEIIESPRFNQTAIRFAKLKNEAGMLGALYYFKEKRN